FRTSNFSEGVALGYYCLARSGCPGIAVSRAQPHLENTLNFYFEGFGFFDGEGEGGEEAWDFLEVFEADKLDGRMHVAVWKADEGGRDSAAGPEDDVGIG